MLRFVTSCSIDARNNVRLARYINDAPRKLANCSSKAHVIHGQPRVLFFATCDISKDTEIRYDYGVADLPWREVRITVLTTAFAII